MENHPEIERIIRHRRKTKCIEMIDTCLQKEPEQAANLVSRLIDLGDPYPGLVMTAALNHLTRSSYPPLIHKAIQILTETDNTQARDFLSEAFFERDISAHPYLNELFLAEHYFRTFYAVMNWRDAGADQIPFLAQFLDDPLRKQRAIQALLELRLSEAFALIPPETNPLYFHQVGFSREENTIRKIYSDQPYNLQFDPEYAGNWMDWNSNRHPTWAETTERKYRFGGVLEDQFCPNCGDMLHHLLTFTVTDFFSDLCSLPRLTIATCNHCLGWEDQTEVIFLRHDDRGVPQSPRPTTINKPQFPCAAFEETTVAITPIPSPFRWQEWGNSVGKGNLHRLGGHPSWIQFAKFPNCPECQQTMPFLLQLDSNLPLVWPNSEQAELMYWGSGGLAYFFWCDVCRISAGMWQCT
jgi:hypothetical protein